LGRIWKVAYFLSGNISAFSGQNLYKLVLSKQAPCRMNKNPFYQSTYRAGLIETCFTAALTKQD
jgi:hypothetical protein